MKTKNIFRTLLVAAALLMGANNVKAGVDGQIWPDNGADNNTAQCSIGGQKFKDANITAGQYLRVYLGNIFGDGGYWQMGFKADNADPEFDAFPGQNWGVETISSQMGVSISSGYIDLKCSANTVTKLKQGGFTIDATGIIIKNVAIVDGSSSGGGGSTTESGELVDVNLGYYDYRTYVTPYVIDFSRSVGVEGYYAKEVSGNNIVFYQVTGKCASGVPLLLKKTDSASKLWKVTDTSVSGTTPDPNLLLAGNQTSPTVSGNNIYVLTYHNGGYVFAETEFQSADVDNQHAYLDLNSVNSGNARAYSIRFVKGNTTGINDIKAETIDSNVIYDLRGQRVERPTKGIYIINGKKVMIK